METLSVKKPEFLVSPNIVTDSSSSVNRSDLLTEIEKLRSIVEDLGERREEDRRSILILQSQIDHMRGYKCSDSLETSFKNMYAVANVLWDQLPTISLGSLLVSRRKKGKKSKNSSKTTSCNSSLSSRKQKRSEEVRFHNYSY